MIAVSATLGGLPAARKASYLAFMVGLKRIATRAGI